MICRTTWWVRAAPQALKDENFFEVPQTADDVKFTQHRGSERAVDKIVAVAPFVPPERLSRSTLNAVVNVPVPHVADITLDKGQVLQEHSSERAVKKGHRTSSRTSAPTDCWTRCRRTRIFGQRSEQIAQQVVAALVEQFTEAPHISNQDQCRRGLKIWSQCRSPCTMTGSSREPSDMWILQHPRYRKSCFPMYECSH